MWIPRFVLVRWTPATKGNSCFNWNKKKCIETTSPNNLQLNNGVCEILNKDFSFILDPAKNKATIGNSCFWLAEIFKIFSQTTITKDVCEVLDKYSSFNLVLIWLNRINETLKTYAS